MIRTGGAGHPLRRAEVVRLAAVTAGFLLLILMVSRCQGARWHTERSALIERAAAARAASVADSVIAAMALERARTHAAERDSLQELASAAIVAANWLRAQRRVIQPVASQPGAAPTVSDTLAAVDSALTLCDQEATILRAALDTNRSIVRLAERETAELRSALFLETTSATRLRTVNADLAAQLARAAPPCRVLFFPCPSRTQVGIGSAILTLVVARSFTP